MPYRELPWSVAPPAVSGLRQLTASALRLASMALALLASRLVAAEQRARVETMPMLEFYAEDGAPEGALYVDGKLFGQLPGVKRL